MEEGLTCPGFATQACLSAACPGSRRLVAVSFHRSLVVRGRWARIIPASEAGSYPQELIP